LRVDLGSLFGKKSVPLVGLDISTSAVKMVELAEAGKNEVKLVRCATEPLPKGAVVDGNIENIDQVAEAVRRVWKKSGATSKFVVLGLPSASVITKQITLPGGLHEDELEVQVESEASQYIPFALDEVSLDFDVIGPSPNSDSTEIDVMLAAARKEKVEDRVAVAEAAGLTPTVMDIETYAARAAVERITSRIPQATGKIIALFHIGSSVTHVSVLLDGKPLYEREQPFGGRQLTQDIVRAYGMTQEEAEERKKTGDLPDGYESEVLAPFLENAALEITRAIQFFFTSTPYTRIDHLFLSGGSAIIPGLMEAVAGRSGIAASVISPFQGMQLSAGIREKQINADGPGYLVACGLAMRRFD
jgi:type IV pilus assembly protein PilM